MSLHLSQESKLLGMVWVVKEWPELTEDKRNEEHKKAPKKMYSPPRIEE